MSEPQAEVSQTAITLEQLQERKAALEEELKEQVNQANQMIAAYRGGITELDRLISLLSPKPLEPAVTVAPAE